MGDETTTATTPATGRRINRGRAAATTPATTVATPKPDEVVTKTPETAPEKSEQVQAPCGGVVPSTPEPSTTDALDGITGLSFSRAGDVDTSEMNYMILIYGDSGAGKTHLASSCDDVIVALLEPQGFATVRTANPSAIVAGDADVSIKGKPRWLKTMQQVRDFFQAAASGRFIKAGIKTIVLDSATELQQMFIDEIVAEKKRRVQPTAAPVAGRTVGQKAAPVAAPEQVKGPAPEMTKQDWGTMAVKWRNFMRMLRGLPYNVVVLALSEPTQDEETGRRFMFPKLSGSSKAALPSFFNLCLYIYKARVEGEIVRLCLADADDKFYTKSFGPINGIVKADLREWFTALAGAEADLHVEGARPPGASGSGGRTIARGGTVQESPAPAETSDAPETSY